MNKHTPRPSDVMAYFDLSDEQWDILPNSVVDRLTEIYMKETAAPAMYEALSTLVKIMEEQGLYPLNVEDAKIALAQAEGRQACAIE